MPAGSIRERSVRRAIERALEATGVGADVRAVAVEISHDQGRVSVSLAPAGRVREVERPLITHVAAVEGVGEVEVVASRPRERAETMSDEKSEMPLGRRSAHLIGPGEVGTRLGDALERGGWSITRVTRTSGWDAATDADDASPRIVAVREEDLGDVLDRLGERLRDRTLLVQNGFLEAVHGTLGPVTRGLIWFMSKGEVFHQLTSSLFYGPMATNLTSSLRDGGLDVATVAEGEPARREMVLKGIWNCVVGLPLAVLEVDLSTFLGERRDEATRLVDECARAASAEYGCEVSVDEAMEVIDDTTSPIGWVKGGKKALAWRNGAVAKFGRRHGIATPFTDRLLSRAGYDPDS